MSQRLVFRCAADLNCHLYPLVAARMGNLEAKLFQKRLEPTRIVQSFMVQFFLGVLRHVIEKSRRV